VWELPLEQRGELTHSQVYYLLCWQNLIWRKSQTVTRRNWVRASWSFLSRVCSTFWCICKKNKVYIYTQCIYMRLWIQRLFCKICFTVFRLYYVHLFHVLLLFTAKKKGGEDEVYICILMHLKSSHILLREKPLSLSLLLPETRVDRQEDSKSNILFYTLVPLTLCYLLDINKSGKA